MISHNETIDIRINQLDWKHTAVLLKQNGKVKILQKEYM